MEENTLANEILFVQENKHLPGLVHECKSLIKSLNLSNLFDEKVSSTCSKLMWKNRVNKAIVEFEESNLKILFSSKSKLKDGPIMGESFGQNGYISDLTLYKARMKFQMRSKMVDAKFNFSAKYEKELWRCDSCLSAIETQSHLMFCLAYASLRVGKDLKNDDHLIDYMQSVMDVRTKLNLRK